MIRLSFLILRNSIGRLDIRGEVFPVFWTGIRISLSRVTETLSGAEEARKLLSEKTDRRSLPSSLLSSQKRLFIPCLELCIHLRFHSVSGKLHTAIGLSQVISCNRDLHKLHWKRWGSRCIIWGPGSISPPGESNAPNWVHLLVSSVSTSYELRIKHMVNPQQASSPLQHREPGAATDLIGLFYFNWNQWLHTLLSA